MSAYVRYYRRLQALTQRLSTYLDRLEARAREFGVSSARTAMEMQITDPASVSAFRSEVEARSCSCTPTTGRRAPSTF